MLNFTVGPVHLSNSIKEIRKQDIPYFRTEEFSNLMFENEVLIKDFFDSKDGKVVFLTGSSTCAMDASVSNTLTKKDKVLIVNGGSFGQRFVEICAEYGVEYEEIKLEYGESLTREKLFKYENKGFTALLVQACETSTGIKYDLSMIGEFCKKQNVFYIVDAVSGFLADKISMDEMGINLMFTGSQKALAISPGLAIMCIDNVGLEKIKNNDCKNYYLNLKSHLKNMERGQTPFTPAVGILLELNARLKQIKKDGLAYENEIISNRAKYFRSKISKYPFSFLSNDMSNCVTALVTRKNAHEIFLELKDKYSIFVCPNGGELKEKVFRVGHIGELSLSDYDKLFNALDNMNKEGKL